METTKDGFTFKRLSLNKGVKMSGKRVVAKEVGAELEFRKVADGHLKGSAMAFVKTKEKAMAAVKAKNGNGGISVKLRKNIVGPQAGTSTAPTNLKDGITTLQTKKRRKTIRLEDSLDISTDSISAAAPLPETRVKVDGVKVGKIINFTKERKMKSNEIHKKVDDGNVNTLMRECLDFLGADTAYSMEIRRGCHSGSFGDINFSKEIEGHREQAIRTKEEIEKWRGIHGELMEQADFTAEAIAEPAVVVEIDERAIEEEFKAKAGRLKELEERTRCFLENSKEKSESILRSIFGAVKDQTVNALFLLKAMSKLGK